MLYKTENLILKGSSPKGLYRRHRVDGGFGIQEYPAHPLGRGFSVTKITHPNYNLVIFLLVVDLLPLDWPLELL